MGVRQSKRALAEAAALLDVDTQTARVYLRDVQRLAGPLPYATIVAAMRAVANVDTSVVAVRAAEMAIQDEHASGE